MNEIRQPLYKLLQLDAINKAWIEVSITLIRRKNIKAGE